MSMAANSNMNFYHQQGHGIFPPSFYNQHVVNFQSGAVYSGNFSSSSSSLISGFGNYGNLIIEPLPGLKHDTGLAVDWSFNEQAILNDGLVKYADEPGTMKYVKIAALLPEKAVRDVALRCQWMAVYQTWGRHSILGSKKESVKRRKVEENYAAKKFQNRMEKMADSSSKPNIHSVPPVNGASYSFLLQSANHNNRYSYEEVKQPAEVVMKFPSEAFLLKGGLKVVPNKMPVVDGATQLLLDENVHVLSQISTNLSNCKLHDNIELFLRTSNNIMATLNSMGQTPGVMSRMAPLPVAINEGLMNTILPITSQAPMYRTPGGISLKQEQDDDDTVP